MQRNGDEADIMELDERNYEMYYQGVDDTGDTNIAVELSNNIVSISNFPRVRRDFSEWELVSYVSVFSEYLN